MTKPLPRVLAISDLHIPFENQYALSFIRHLYNEFTLSKQKIKQWIKEFPKAKCLIGNHEGRINKRLTENGIPKEFIKSFNDLFGLPKEWIWNHSYNINGVEYLHGNRDGIYSHVNIARDSRMSTVTGHTHTSAGTHYLANASNTIFALNVGCLIDQSTYAFNYSAEQTRKAVLGSGIVINNIPHFIPM